MIKLLLLTVALLGCQVLWTVELGYGTPYLLQLGFTKAESTLTWLAGPLSGLIIQPIVGKLSDNSKLQIWKGWGRRKPFLLLFSALTLVSIILVAFPDLLVQEHFQKKITVVVGFYVLDACLNGVLAMARCLIVDCLPASQQQEGHATASWMISIGNAVGYAIGATDLSFLKLFQSQMKSLSIVVSLIFVVCIAATLFGVHELPKERNNVATRVDTKSILGTLLGWAALFSRLPRPILLLFISQFFSWFSWFPVLFYSSQYVQDHAEGYKQKDLIGSAALLNFSLLSIVTSFIAPRIIKRYDLKLNNALAYSHIALFLSMCVGTFIVSSLTTQEAKLMGSIVLVSLNGIMCALTFWIPFALLGEFLAEQDEHDYQTGTRGFEYAAIVESEGELNSSDALRRRDRLKLKRTKTYPVTETTASLLVEENGISKSEEIILGDLGRDQLSTGIILGLHNTCIVLPQFFATLTCGLVFEMVRKAQLSHDLAGERQNALHLEDSVAWAWRICGLTSLLASYFVLKAA